MSASIKKVKARDEFIRFAETETERKLQNLSAIQLSHELTRFYVKEIHNRIKTEIPDEELDLAIVDGSSDLGCDLIYRDDNHVLIIQSKFRGQSSREKPEDISHFQSVFKRLIDSDVRANGRVLDQISCIDWSNDQFTLVFISLGSLDNQAGAISGKQPHYPSHIPDLEMRCDWHYLDEQRLNEEYRSAVAYERGPSDKAVTLYPKGPRGDRGTSSIISVDAGEYRSVIMALDAKQIINAYKSLGSESIFSLNIRNFIGNTVTNKRIMRTAKENPLSFFLFNNGISCLCTSLKDHTDRIEVTGLQVINGAQTVKALVNVARASRSTPPEWNETPPIVLVRITEIPGGYGQAGQMRESITQFNNTQNVIKVSDFRSNDPVQTGLKQQSAKIKYRGKQVDYQPKRTDRTVRNAEVVRLEEFAKTVYAFLEDPIDFSGATAFLFDEQAGGYNKIFGDGNSVWEQMPEDEFRLRAAVYWLSKEFSQRLKEERKLETDADTRAALERKWILLSAARTVIQHYYRGRWKAELAKTYKGDWELGEGGRGKIFSQVFRDAKAGVVMAYKNAKAHDPTFVHRNWMRSKSTPAKVADVLNTIILVVRDPLPEMPESQTA